MAHDAKLETPIVSTQLVRQLGLISSIFICMSNEIGSGVFLVGSDIAASVPAPLMGLLVWVVGGAITLTGALIFAELGTMFPQAGGQYVFLREAFHPIVSFLFGWTLIFVIQTGSIAGVAVAFAKFLNPFLPMTDIEKNIAATLIIVTLTIFNFLGIKRGSQLLDAITWVKIFTIAGIVAFVLSVAPATSASPMVIEAGNMTVSGFGVALLAAFWAFDGWYSITFVAGEMKKPERDIPLASLIAIVGTTSLYVLASYCYYHVLNHDQIVKSSFVAADAIRALSGEMGVKILGIIVIISVLGCINAMIISGARVVYAMAKDNVLPPVLAVVNPKTHSPNRSLVMQMCWSIALVWSGKYDELFTYVIFGAFIFYGLTAFGLFWLRKTKPNLPRPYKVPLYPMLPAAYVLFTICLTINSLHEKPKESAAGLFIIALGLPAYWLMKKFVAKKSS
jgi:basic amino acid/polyamine antiporter, APA family